MFAKQKPMSPFHNNAMMVIIKLLDWKFSELTTVFLAQKFWLCNIVNPYNTLQEMLDTQSDGVFF